MVIRRRPHVAPLAALATLLLLRVPRAPNTRYDTINIPLPPSSVTKKTNPAPVTSPLVAVKFILPAPLISKVTTTSAPSLVVPDKSIPTAPVKFKVTVKDASLPVLTGDLYVAGHQKSHPELCPFLGEKLRLIILVTSAPSHFEARDGVRMTWGHFATRSDIAFAFVLGVVPDTLRPAIKAEDMLYGDIIVGSFIDSYSNLTLKTLSMLEWVDTYCPRVPRMLKTDEDVFINVPRLIEFMKAPTRVNATKTIWGSVAKKLLPMRTSQSKYFISPLQFPGEVFPDFTNGPAYLLTTDVIRHILAAAPSEPYLTLEDVFITGVLGNKLGIERQDALEFYNRKITEPFIVKRVISVHEVNYHEQFDLWEKSRYGKMNRHRFYDKTITTPPPILALTGDVYVAGHQKSHPELCSCLGAKLQLLILVISEPSDFEARDAVRMTWGHFTIRSDIAFAFVIGVPPDTMRPAIEAEDLLYSDIIIGSFIDSYSNLTLKTLSMLEWVDTYCPRVPRMLKTDDDVFINVPRLIEFMKAPSRANATKTIWGNVVKKLLPKRTSRSKYFVSPLEFPGEVFPDFTTGPAYLLTTDVISHILAAAPSEPYLRLEDVFITGVLGNKLGIKRQHATEFYNRKVADPCVVQRGISVNEMRCQQQFDLWRRLHDGEMKLCL